MQQALSSGPCCAAQAQKPAVHWHSLAYKRPVQRQVQRPVHRLLATLGDSAVPMAARTMSLLVLQQCLPHSVAPSAGFDSTSPFATGPITVGMGMPGPAPRSLAARTADVVNVKDYYARGDGKGASPSDEGVDISNEPWNNWTK